MSNEDLSYHYFPEDYRWSHGMLIGLNSAPWGGAEIGEIHRIGLRLRPHLGDDTAWFREWAREAGTVEGIGRSLLADGHKASAASYLLRNGVRPSGLIDVFRNRIQGATWSVNTSGPAPVPPSPPSTLM